MSYWPRICPICREELPERGNRRVYVPWKLGYRLVHAGACADVIDAQGVLDFEQKPGRRRDPVLHVRIRRLAQLLGGEDQRRKLTHEDRESVRRIALLLAREDHVDVAHAPDERLQQGLLNRRQILDLMRQLAHACEVSASPRMEVA